MDWSKVVIYPLGLVAFALILIFKMVTKTDPRKISWFLIAALIFFAIVVLGGLYLENKRIEIKAKQEKSPQILREYTRVQQETHGAGSPAVQGVQGNVNIITTDQKENTKK